MRFAVQAFAGEVDLHIAEVFLKKAHALGVQFKRLDVIEPITIGSMRYFRLETPGADSSPVLDGLFEDGRSVIEYQDGGFVLRLKDRKATISASTMQTSQKPPKFYRGTLDPFWDRQFAKS